MNPGEGPNHNTIEGLDHSRTRSKVCALFWDSFLPRKREITRKWNSQRRGTIRMHHNMEEKGVVITLSFPSTIAGVEAHLASGTTLMTLAYCYRASLKSRR
jgi:hypothetical protein